MKYRINIDGINEIMLLTIGTKLETHLRVYDKQTKVTNIMSETSREELEDKLREINKNKRRGTGKTQISSLIMELQRKKMHELENKNNDIDIIINGLNSVFLFEDEVMSEDIQTTINCYSNYKVNINVVILPNDKDAKKEISDKLDRMYLRPSRMVNKLGEFYLNMRERTLNNFTIFIEEHTLNSLECTPSKRAELIFEIVKTIVDLFETLRYNSRLRNVKLNKEFQRIVNENSSKGLEFIIGHTRKIINTEECDEK